MVERVIINMLNEQIRGIICIYLFGSYLGNKNKKDGDIDIAILAERKLNNMTRWEASNMLADKLKKEIDLIDLRGVSTVMKAQVVSNGTCIYETERKQRDMFEMYTLSDYARLNEERKEIIERIKKDGFVYAR
jgi:predicted nucleotidyltransferase